MATSSGSGQPGSPRFAYDNDGGFDYGDPDRGGREMLRRLGDTYADAGARYLAIGTGNSAISWTFRWRLLPVQGEHLNPAELEDYERTPRDNLLEYAEQGTDPLKVTAGQARSRGLPLLANLRINRGFLGEPRPPDRDPDGVSRS